MKWGLTQGLIGARDNAPSLAALGPNTYLDQRDFLKMLGAAIAAHALVFGIASLFPHEKVTNIPVRALSFKLGDQNRIAAYGSRAMAPAIVAAPAMVASAPIAPVAPPVAQEAAPRITPAPAPAPKREPQKPKPPPPALPKFTPPPAVPAPPAIAPNPQQYVRESAPIDPRTGLPSTGILTGAIGGSGYETTQTEQTTQAIRERYEQQISSWIARHLYYPAEGAGRTGRVIIRMRIDRSGVVRYYALEQSSGVQAIDAAAIEIIRRANPVPAVPANYPAGNLIEFLIPVVIAPQ